MKQFILYLGAFLPCVWGVSHLIPTRNVVKGFGDISLDNRRIITMEWIGEGITLIFIGALVAGVTLQDPESALAFTVYVLSAATLIVMAIVSVFTGFRIDFLPFRLCPFIFTTSAILIVVGSLM